MEVPHDEIPAQRVGWVMVNPRASRQRPCGSRRSGLRGDQGLDHGQAVVFIIDERKMPLSGGIVQELKT
jgi:hypothetical protein